MVVRISKDYSNNKSFEKQKYLIISHVYSFCGCADLMVWCSQMINHNGVNKAKKNKPKKYTHQQKQNKGNYHVFSSYTYKKQIMYIIFECSKNRNIKEEGNVYNDDDYDNDNVDTVKAYHKGVKGN